jgi:hypothetical protein
MKTQTPRHAAAGPEGQALPPLDPTVAMLPRADYPRPQFVRSGWLNLNGPGCRLTREWIELINRDYNHPSIVIWVPVNESWAVPNLSDPLPQAYLRALYYLTKSLDGTRLVIDNDG